MPKIDLSFDPPPINDLATPIKIQGPGFDIVFTPEATFASDAKEVHEAIACAMLGDDTWASHPTPKGLNRVMFEEIWIGVRHLKMLKESAEEESKKLKDELLTYTKHLADMRRAAEVVLDAYTKRNVSIDATTKLAVAIDNLHRSISPAGH